MLSRPSLRTAALGHAGIARLRRRSLAALRAASSPFPPSPFRIQVTREAGKDGAVYSSPSDVRPSRTASGRERRDDDASLHMRSALDHRETQEYVRRCNVRFIRASPLYPRNVRFIAMQGSAALAASRDF